MGHHLCPKKNPFEVYLFPKKFRPKKLSTEKFPFCKSRRDTLVQYLDTGNLSFVNIVARRAQCLDTVCDRPVTVTMVTFAKK